MTNNAINGEVERPPVYQGWYIDEDGIDVKKVAPVICEWDFIDYERKIKQLLADAQAEAVRASTSEMMKALNMIAIKEWDEINKEQQGMSVWVEDMIRAMQIVEEKVLAHYATGEEK